MASNWPPAKGEAFTLYFSLYRSDGSLITDPGSVTKKLSKDGGAFADIAASVTEHSTTYGLCSVTLSATEMDADAVSVYIADDTPGCVPFTCTLYTAGQTLDTTNAAVTVILKLLRNRTVTDASTGLITVYDDDGVTPLFSAAIFEDAAGLYPYDGSAINRRDRLE